MAFVPPVVGKPGYEGKNVGLCRQIPQRTAASLLRVRIVGTGDAGGRDDKKKSSGIGKGSGPGSGGGPSIRQRRLKSQRSKQALTDEYGRVGCYCTCEEFDLEHVMEFMQVEPSAEIIAFDDSLHFRKKDRTEESVFVFPYGAVVIWGMDIGSEQLLLKDLRQFEMAALENPEADEFRYVYNLNPSINNEAMTLTSGAEYEEILRERLALSHALAQSVKLAAFEQSVQRTIAETRYLPMELALKGKISASREEVSKSVGRLFVDRHNVYLYADILDTPDYFWDYESHEWLYAEAARYLELQHRAEWLFRRLDMVRELYDLLGHELQFKHSSDLEMIIIFLIMFEIVLTLAHDWVEVIVGGAIGPKAGNVLGILFLTVAIGIMIGIFITRQWRRRRRNKEETLLTMYRR